MQAQETGGPDGVVFDSTLGAWVVDDAALCRRLLGHDDLAPPAYVDLYGELERHFGLDFSNMRFAFGHIPLCLHGEEHAAARRAIGTELRVRRAEVGAAMADMVARHFAALGRPGEVELMAGVVEPFVAELMGRLIGVVDPQLGPDSLISRIFSRGMGIAKRKRAEREVAGLRARIAATGPADEDETGYRLAMMILGRDALTGTLANSLRRVFEAADGRPLREIAIDAMPGDTGVAYVERVARAAVTVDGLALEPGDRVRLMLTAFARSNAPGDAARIFGSGAHTCLGRPVSLEAWQAIRALLATLETRVEIVGHSPRADDIFAVPATLTLQVHP